jgi:hypothetical protein
MAFASGTAVLLFLPRYHRKFFDPAVWGWGTLLGAVNFGSIFFMVRTLNYSSPEGKGFDSSLVFGVNNLGIVTLSVVVGLWVFRERLFPLNWMGIALSGLAILLFSMS